jgi:hypothetical protein
MIAIDSYSTENNKVSDSKTCNYSISDNSNNKNNNNYDFFAAIEKQANAQFQTMLKIYYDIIIKKGAVVEYFWPVKPHNYTWCKYCDKKEQIIVFQLIERYRILHGNSFFHWRKQTLRKYWGVFDEDTGLKHVHTQDKRRNQKQQQDAAAITNTATAATGVAA